MLMLVKERDPTDWDLPTIPTRFGGSESNPPRLCGETPVEHVEKARIEHESPAPEGAFRLSIRSSRRPGAEVHISGPRIKGWEDTRVGQPNGTPGSESTCRGSIYVRFRPR